MTKKEKIQEAYGEFWNIVKDWVNENGWCEKRRAMKFEEIKKYCDIEYGAYESYWFRPKSLHGIEHNNDWVKIESESDLPKENGLYFVFWYLLKGELNSTSFRDFHVGTEDSKFWMANYSHYQPIKMPKTPIY